MHSYGYEPDHVNDQAQRNKRRKDERFVKLEGEDAAIATGEEEEQDLEVLLKTIWAQVDARKRTAVHYSDKKSSRLKIATVTTAEKGVLLGQNEPSVRKIERADQEMKNASGTQNDSFLESIAQPLPLRSVASAYDKMLASAIKASRPVMIVDIETIQSNRNDRNDDGSTQHYNNNQYDNGDKEGKREDKSSRDSRRGRGGGDGEASTAVKSFGSTRGNYNDNGQHYRYIERAHRDPNRNAYGRGGADTERTLRHRRDTDTNRVGGVEDVNGDGNTKIRERESDDSDDDEEYMRDTAGIVGKRLFLDRPPRRSKQPAPPRKTNQQQDTTGVTTHYVANDDSKQLLPSKEKERGGEKRSNNIHDNNRYSSGIPAGPSSSSSASRERDYLGTTTQRAALAEAATHNQNGYVLSDPTPIPFALNSQSASDSNRRHSSSDRKYLSIHEKTGVVVSVNAGANDRKVNKLFSPSNDNDRIATAVGNDGGEGRRGGTSLSPAANRAVAHDGGIMSYKSPLIVLSPLTDAGEESDYQHDLRSINRNERDASIEITTADAEYPEGLRDVKKDCVQTPFDSIEESRGGSKQLEKVTGRGNGGTKNSTRVSVKEHFFPVEATNLEDDFRFQEGAKISRPLPPIPRTQTQKGRNDKVGGDAVEELWDSPGHYAIEKSPPSASPHYSLSLHRKGDYSYTSGGIANRSTQTGYRQGVSMRKGETPAVHRELADAASLSTYRGERTHAPTSLGLPPLPPQPRENEGSAATDLVRYDADDGEVKADNFNWCVAGETSRLAEDCAPEAPQKHPKLQEEKYTERKPQLKSLSFPRSPTAVLDDGLDDGDDILAKVCGLLGVRSLVN